MRIEQAVQGPAVCAPTIDQELARLEAELRAKRQQQEAAVRERDRQQELRRAAQEREAARIAAEATERQRLLDVADRAGAQPLPSGVPQLEGLNADEVDMRHLKDLFPLVLVAEGPLSLPVIACHGAALSLKDGPALQVRRAVSQLILADHKGSYLPLYRELARKEFAALVAAERTRAPEASILYTAALPTVQVMPDADNPRLCRVAAAWGDCFAYTLPSLTTPQE